jgi:phytoene dehydrogenase-like protein
MTPDAVVVGSGPNGLAAAVALAQQGYAVQVLEAHDEIGGGTRTAELTEPGLLHDVCSAIHPFSLASPYLSSLPLADHGLVWRFPEIDLAHPLDDGTAGVMKKALSETAIGLGADGRRWLQVFQPLADRMDDLAQDVLGPIVRWPDHPLLMAAFGARAGLPATVLARTFRTEQAKALFLGCAAHMYRPLNGLGTAAVGSMLVAAGHAHGWPVAEGGSRAITDALASLLRSLGGTITTGAEVKSLADVPRARATLFDTTPDAFARIAGSRLPSRRARAYRKWRYGPGAFKVDLAVRGGIPWTNEAARRAGTVHLGGSGAEIAAAEADVARGRMPERPFILIGQQYLADPTRSAGDLHPIWAYAHVPQGYDGDGLPLVLDQIERFAPGFRDTIVSSRVMTPGDYASYNLNYVGGDIAAGANDLRQLVLRPSVQADPYDAGIPGMFLCSSSTPPGAGVHGMCGYRAAQRALAYLS